MATIVAGLLFWLQWQIGGDMRRMMNTSVNPCDDFYSYACGNFKNLAPLTEDKPLVSRFSKQDDQIKKELRNILEEPIKSDDPQSAMMTKLYYKSCINEKKLEALGLQPLKALIKKFGGWPVVEGKNWNEAEYDWMKMNALMQTSIGGNQFVEFSINADLKNSRKKTLFIDQASLGMGKREYYLNKSLKAFLDSYLEFLIASAVQLGATEAAAKEEMKELLEFETALAQANMRDEDRRDTNVINHPMTIKELKAKYPQINFDLWFKTISEWGWKFEDSELINLSGMQFMEKLPGILANFSARTLANYQIWSIVQSWLPFLAPSLRENYRRFRQAMYGAPKFKPRWEECMDLANSIFALPIGGMYVRKYFSEEAKKQLDDMVGNIRDAMKSTIDTVHWMDESTKNNAQKKLANMIQNIAFPNPDIYNETWLMRDYKKAEVHEDSFLDNAVSVIASKINWQIQDFRNPVNRTEWLGSIAIVNAWYSPERNKMSKFCEHFLQELAVHFCKLHAPWACKTFEHSHLSAFPAGILKYSFYSPHAPDYYNYGRIGAVMGHEMTHGFDDQGRQYDSNGNFELWWSNETLAEFKKGAKCFIDQYGNITDPTTGQKLNGENTQGENIADNGGVKLAFLAFQNSFQSSDPRNRLFPTFTHFTAEQLFFLSYAQTWCKNMRVEALKNQIVYDPHSPATYRVNVPLQNNPHFAEAYNCPVGSNMNPPNKCQIW